MARDPNAVVQATRILMDAPRARREVEPIATRELSPTELLAKPTQTLAKIVGTLDRFIDEMDMRVREGSASLRDVKSFTDLVKAHATLRQTQLAEDEFASKAQSISTDTDIAMLLIEAVKAGGPEAKQALKAALAQMEQDEPAKP